MVASDALSGQFRECKYCEEHDLVKETNWGSWIRNPTRHAIGPMHEQLSLFDKAE